jgi:hypothetical protein
VTKILSYTASIAHYEIYIMHIYIYVLNESISFFLLFLCKILYRMMLSRHIYLIKTININRPTPQSNLFIDISVSFFFLFFSLSLLSVHFHLLCKCRVCPCMSTTLLFSFFSMPLCWTEWLAERTVGYWLCAIELAWHMSMGDGYY